MRFKKQNLLGEASRFWELLVGWSCALISLAFGILLIYLVYIVGWRNPRQFGSDELLKVKTLVIFSVLLIIAVAFSLFANRLILRKKPNQRLMSPLVLRIWGTFFALTSIAVFSDGVFHNRWRDVPHLWHILSGSVSIAVAAFALARKWKREEWR